MPQTLDPELRRALVERVRYCHEMGIYDFYRRENAATGGVSSAVVESEIREEMAARKSAVGPAIAATNLVAITSTSESGITDSIAALKLIRGDLGDCHRCQLQQS